MRARLFPHPALSLLVLFVGLALATPLSPLAIGLAGLAAIVIPLFSAPFLGSRARLASIPAAAALAAVVAFDMLVSAVRVSALILFRPRQRLRGCWLIVPLDLALPEAAAVLAGTVSLTPGTLSADFAADGRHLLVHALDCPDAPAAIARIKHRYERRIARMFGC